MLYGCRATVLGLLASHRFSFAAPPDTRVGQSRRGAWSVRGEG
jgi:hypothetical protein